MCGAGADMRYLFHCMVSSQIFSSHHNKKAEKSRGINYIYVLKKKKKIKLNFDVHFADYFHQDL